MGLTDLTACNTPRIGVAQPEETTIYQRQSFNFLCPAPTITSSDGLNNLQFLTLDFNQITNLSDLSTLINLKALSVDGNVAPSADQYERSGLRLPGKPVCHQLCLRYGRG